MKMAMQSTWYKDGYLLRQNYTYSKYIYCEKDKKHCMAL